MGRDVTHVRFGGVIASAAHDGRLTHNPKKKRENMRTLLRVLAEHHDCFVLVCDPYAEQQSVTRVCSSISANQYYIGTCLVPPPSIFMVRTVQDRELYLRVLLLHSTTNKRVAPEPLTVAELGQELSADLLPVEIRS